jgi:serine/threonine protein kinase
VVDRPRWIEANIDGFRQVLAPLNEKAAERAKAANPALVSIGARITGVEVGALLSYLAPKVLGYAAPEQRVRGKQIDKRADMYAIGLMLNEMFTHEIPQGTRYKTISSISPEYSYLDEIVDKMISQTPEERPISIHDVKQLLRIRGADYVSEQQLSKLKAVVIPASKIDDPLVVNPIRIEGFEWDGGLLTLILSQPVNQKWRNALLNMGSYTSSMGRGPETFTFEGNLAKVRAEERLVQDIVNYFKSWIPLATRRYEQDLQDERRRKEEQERQKIRVAIEAEEAKARLRKNIKL